MRTFPTPLSLGSVFDHCRLLAVLVALLSYLGLSSQNVATYTFAQSSGTYTAITGGTQLWDEADNINDEAPATVGIPAFPFAGNVYTTMYVSSNGFLTFGSAPSSGNNTPLSSTATYAGAVSAFGADLEDASTGSNTEVRWQTVGNEVVVQWQNVERANVSNNDEVISFQIRLNTVTGAIACVYAAVSGLENSVMDQPQVGLRGANNTFATNVNNRTVTTVTSGAGSSWANTAVGTANSTTCRCTSGSPARSPGAGQTYTWTPPCTQVTLPNAGGDQSICQTATATLAANTPSVGTAAWSVVSGPSTSNGQFSSLSSPTAVFTPAGGAGTYTLRWTISNSPCPSRTDDVVITVAGTPTTANAGSDQQVCSTTGTTALAGNAAAVGTGTWTSVSGPSAPGITTPGSATSGVTGLTSAGTYVFQWTIANSPCASSSDQVSIVVTAPPSVNTGTYGPLCTNASPISLSGTPSGGTWAGTGVSGSTFDPAVADMGTHGITYTVISGPCTVVQPTNIVVNQAPTNTNANATSSTVCAGSPVDLSASADNGILLSENFNGPTNNWTTTNTSTGGTVADAAWTLRPNSYFYNASTGTDPTFNSNDNSQFYLSNSDDQGSGTTATTLVSPAFSTVGQATLTLTYYHHYRFNSGTGDRGRVEVSTNGSSWTTVQTHSSTQGAVNGFVLATVDLSAYVNEPSLQVRFRYAATFDWWWALDNVTVTGDATGALNYAWTSTPSGFTSNSQNPTGVSVTQTTTYQVTVSTPAGCTTTASVAVTAIDPPDAGSNGAITVCSIDAAVSLFAQLGGTPDVGGAWSGPSTVIGGMYDPATMDPGTYTYLVTGNTPCADASASVAVTENAATAWYQDLDNDGFGDPNVSQMACAQPGGYVANNTDLCPSDVNKQNPGQCGCGNPETDTDSDGTADCIDGCVNDPNKIAPGVCGCGVADVATTYYADGDVDGFGDPNSPLAGYTCVTPPGYVTNNTDLCPTDANKQSPGQCGCGNLETDTDSDGTADCVDGCVNDPNKTAPGQCGCGNPETDTDSDGTADCVDGCVNDPNKTAPGQCGCGVPDTDTDGDLTADCNDNCPNDPNKTEPGVCGCGVSDADTDNDGTQDCNDECPEDPNKIVTGECGCGVVDTDTDGDLTADCNDNCPNDPNKVNPGACGCGNLETDTDGDTYADCVDGCPTDANKVAPGACGCGVADVDTDNDGLLDCVDNCPTIAGQIGSACDDGNPATANDVITNTCTCVGTVTGTLTHFALSTDNDAASTSWDVIPLAGGAPLCSGNSYTNNTTYTLDCVLPDGCYRLRVFDANMDGLCCMNGTGGYTLRLPDGRRIIDAANNGIFSSTADVALGFCLPLGIDRLTSTRCDREDLLPSDFIQAVPNPAVQAQYNVGVQSDDGYQFWIFNPNGGYSRRVLYTHATNNYPFPTGANRCSYLLISNLVTSPIPHNVLLNVRVRSMVNGVYSEFGPTCRMRIDLANQCPTTQLINDVNNAHNSCGLTGVVINGSRTLYAVPVSGANKYQFEFTKPGYLRKISMPTSSLNLVPWVTLPLQYNSTYNVRVRVSFDNGVNFCPFAGSCTMSTAAAPPMQGGQGGRTLDAVEQEVGSLRLWPNPNTDGRFTLQLDGLEETAHSVSIDVFDMAGKSIHAEGLNVDGGMLNTVINLANGVEPGMYMVQLRVDDQIFTERLIIQ